MAVASTHLVIADDHPLFRNALRQAVASVLAEAVVDEAGSFEDLTALLEKDSEVDLVLLDLTMPGMDGYATFTALRQLQPDQRIVVFSGYSAQDAKQRFAGQNLNGFLQKPFSTDSLREVLREATLN